VDERQEVDRFRRGSASRGGSPGTGLGLAIARTLAARWGGTVTIGNRPEGGARAQLRLPRAEVPAEESWVAEEVGVP
jgi:signal transduction histidine kinase